MFAKLVRSCSCIYYRNVDDFENLLDKRDTRIVIDSKLRYPILLFHPTYIKCSFTKRKSTNIYAFIDDEYFINKLNLQYYYEI
jgi:hypothetical protein